MCQNEGTHQIVKSFSPPVVGCLLKKAHKRGGHRHPRTPPGYAPEASPTLRQKRSHAGPCYIGDYQTVQLASGGVAKFPICRKVALTGCASSIPSYQMRLCVASLTKILIRNDDGSNQFCEFAKNCPCAA